MLREKFSYFLSNNNMFIKLFASFMFVIIVLSLFSLANNSIYLENIENNIFEASEQNFSNYTKEFETYFDKVNTNVVSPFCSSYENINSHNISMYGMVELVSELNSYMRFDDSIVKIVLYFKDFDYVITNGESSGRDIFFSNFFQSESYSNEFWDSLFSEEFSNKILPAQVFNDFGREQYVIPYVFKKYYNSNYLLITFLDADKFLSSLNLNSSEIFYVKDYNDNLILSSEPIDSQRDTNGDLEIVSDSSSCTLKFGLTIKHDLFIEEIRYNNRRFTLLIISATMLCVIISLLLVKYFNNPIKQISTVINSQDYNCGTDIIEIANTVGLISQKKSEYQEDLNRKNSMLQDIFLQAELHNLLLTNPSVENEFNRKYFRFSKYILIYFKLHKKKFDFNLDTNSILIAVKELIGNYVSGEFSDNFTFITDRNAVVSVVNITNKNIQVKDRLKKIVKKLILESDLVYFTVVYSEICSDISQINSVYQKLEKSLKYRILKNETQLISTGELSSLVKKYDFPYEIQEKIKNHIKNSLTSDAIQAANDLIDSNIEKQASSYSIQLLCIDIFIICKHCIDESCNTMPNDFNTTKYYDMLQDCSYAQHYKDVVNSIIEKSINYIDSHKSDNFIVNYVKTYINDNFKSDISYDLIAENLHITRPYLTTYFKSKTGINPSDYLNRIRINKSIHLLSNTSLKVKEVSQNIGIYNVSTFIRMFKKHMGMTPVEFKRMNH